MIPAIAITIAVWIVLAALCLPGWACTVGSLKRRWARRQHHTVLSFYRPPVPRSEPAVESDEDWLDVWPGDTPLEVIEQAIFDGLFRNHPDVAADLRKSGAA